jgi:hypothetical protein
LGDPSLSSFFLFVAVRIDPGAATDPPTQAKTALRTPAEAVSINRYVPKQWNLNTETPDVTVEHKVDLGEGRFGPKLQSTVHHDVAEARLKNNALGSTLTVRLLVEPSGRLGVRLGATQLVFDGGRVTIDGVTRVRCCGRRTDVFHDSLFAEFIAKECHQDSSQPFNFADVEHTV